MWLLSSGHTFLVCRYSGVFLSIMKCAKRRCARGCSKFGKLTSTRLSHPRRHTFDDLRVLQTFLSTRRKKGFERSENYWHPINQYPFLGTVHAPDTGPAYPISYERSPSDGTPLICHSAGLKILRWDCRSIDSPCSTYMLLPRGILSSHYLG